jgi:hypothetical protein
MVSNEHEIVLGVPAAEVFAWVADLDGWHRWRPSEGRLEQLTPGPVGVGTTWEAAGRVLDEDIAVTIEVIAYEPDTRFGLLVAGSIHAEQTFGFEPVAQGTRVTLTLELADPQLDEPARARWDTDLRTLKRLARRGRAVAPRSGLRASRDAPDPPSHDAVEHDEPEDADRHDRGRRDDQETQCRHETGSPEPPGSTHRGVRRTQERRTWPR